MKESTSRLLCEKRELREIAGGRQPTDAMDVGDQVKQPEAIPKTAALAPGSTVQPKRTVDLESMAFSQGGHLMLNKKCKLPDGSFKQVRKGSKEIHIPAPKQKPPVDGELVPISDLLHWAQEAFIVPSLNRIRSKLYPITFSTDEPILLCAPTGADKVRQYRSTMPSLELTEYLDQRGNTHNSQ